MKYFIDTEFHEDGRTIDLISIALVREDGRELYAEVENFDYSKVNDWVRENVVPHLWHRRDNIRSGNEFTRDGGRGGLLPISGVHGIALEVRRFIGDDTPEFWGYYADYDWVVFCQMFGTMMDLPKGFPMFCRDIMQLVTPENRALLPPQPENEHHALSDARWNRDAYLALTGVLT